MDIKPEDFGYFHNENEQFIPQITNDSLILKSSPKLYSCLKCARKNVCECREMCCKYCKYGAGDDCQNLIH